MLHKQFMNKDNDWFDRQQNEADIDAVIRKKLKETVSSESSVEMLGSIKKELEFFLINSFNNLDKPLIIKSLHKELLEKLTDLSKAKVISGTNNLNRIRDKGPFLILSNHFGIIPLTLIDNYDNKFTWPLKQIGVFPARMMALNLLSKILDINFVEVAIELPEPIATIQRASPQILIPRDSKDRVNILHNKLQKIIDGENNIGIVIYPEGNMSGKFNRKGPYDMDQFHLGPFVLAKQLELKILPVCQYFNPSQGFELSILKPLEIKNEDSHKLTHIAEQTHQNMQNVLNNMQSVNF